MMMMKKKTRNEDALKICVELIMHRAVSLYNFLKKKNRSKHTCNMTLTYQLFLKLHFEALVVDVKQ